MPGRCRTFALVVAYGKYGTPCARIIHETITAWFHILHEYLTRGKQADIHAAWNEAHATLRKARKDCKFFNAGTRGLLSNVISVLLNVGWKPTTYNLWHDPDTGPWVLSDASVAPHIVIRKVINSAHAKRMLDAQHHHNAKGIGDGVDWNCT